MAHTFNPGTQEAEASDGCEVEGSLGYVSLSQTELKKACLKNKNKMKYN